MTRLELWTWSCVIAAALSSAPIASLLLSAEASAAPRTVVLSPGKHGADLLVEAMAAGAGPKLPKADAKRFAKVLRAAERGDAAALTAAWDVFADAYFDEKTRVHARALELVVLAKAAQLHAPELARRAKIAADAKRDRERIAVELAALETAHARAQSTGKPVAVKPGDTAAKAEVLTAGQITARIAAAETKLQEMNASFNMQYLALQQQMQDENRKFTVLSNIMKTRHDTAKNAISNVR